MALRSRIKLLEERFQTRLIEKYNDGKLKLTEAGQLLYDRASYLCQIEESTMVEIKALEQGKMVTLDISLSPSTSLFFIEDYLADFAKKFPNFTFNLNEVSAEKLEKDILYGASEFGVSCVPLVTPAAFNVVFQEDIFLSGVYKADNMCELMLRNETIDIKDIENVPLMISRGCVNIFERACRDLNIKTNILSVNTTKISTIKWAEKNFGMAIVPMRRGEKLSNGMCWKKIDGPDLAMRMQVLVGKSHAISSEVQTLFEYCSQHNKKWCIN